MASKRPPADDGDEDEAAPPKKTRKEWQRYVDGLAVDELADVAEVTNTAAFVLAMQRDGYDGDDVHHVLVMFAKRFQREGLVPPPGGYVDLEWLADNP